MKWREAEERGTARALRFLLSFSVTAEYANAFIEGWHKPLMAYAKEAAMYQAKKIEGLKNVGVMTQTVAGWDSPEKNVIDQRMQEFVRQSADAIKRGVIEISPPQEAVAYWKENFKEYPIQSHGRER